MGKILEPIHLVIVGSIPFTMHQDEVDPSVITDELWKQTLSSYVHNQDNISGDRDQYVKRIKEAVNPHQENPKLLKFY